MPARVILAVAGDAEARRAGAEVLDPRQRLLHLRLLADDADEVLHGVLQIRLEPIGVLALITGVERAERIARRPLDRRLVDAGRTMFAGKLRSVLAGALPEDDQIRQRIAAQPVRAVDA